MAKPEKGPRSNERARVTLSAVAAGLDLEARNRALVRQVERERVEIHRQRAEIAALKIELGEQREQYAELFDFAPVGHLTLDHAGIIQSINLTAAHLLCAERTRLIGMPLLGSVLDRDRRRLLDHLRKCRTSGGLVTLDLELPAARGGVTPVQLVSKHRAGVGATSILSALIDMTEREAALAEQRRSEVERHRIEHAHEVTRAESAAKDRFLAVLSHELRNPLSPILFTVETLERGLVPPERMAGALALIRRNLDLEVRLIDDLLDVSRITHGKLMLERQVVDLHEVVRDVADGVATDLLRAALTLTTDLSAADHRVNGDPARLRQIIWNLVTNAIRNTPLHGGIVIRTHNLDDWVVLAVRDTGRGVAAHRLETIFQPFDQVDPVGRRRGGLGLGLAICRGLVEAHGGSITAISDGLERGATFTVVLPIVSDVQRMAPSPVAIRLPARRLRILVVEDDVDAAEAMATVLELRGHEVVVAHSVAQGLAYGRNPFDVLVSDIGLPDGTGTDLMQVLRQRGETLGIAISGFGTPEDVRKSLAAGFERHLTKPVHMDELLAAIELIAR